MLFQIFKTFVRLRNTNYDIFDEIRELSDPASGSQIHIARTSMK